ncbi:MAG: ketose-bisphosphate aldolase [Atopobiaceae bacterium]|nr:ketose-bisphosphate aldolase [Atopobiaceae bacterium]MCH4213503.1 ketose-bisphosphate aldolase [Atopobiaceae bacterium]MCH4229725.1 ketose-bisphosphate aldolase [Atopobiaceae bacterium]MCH4276150.1 ketose-bisphosphate aldolase [Atopobiaceae bacterium]MCI1227160.1 ketose-bisphosphate aldolase [Atopobiaceae bacterium]
MNQMLEVAKENHFAVGAFNVADSNFMRTVAEAAEENDSPAIIAIHPTELAYVKDDFIAYVLDRVKNSPVPFVVHMDHGDSLASIVRAVHAGFSSVMIDGSLLPFEENIATTKQVVDVCHLVDVSVEGELGTIGTTGTSVEGGMTEVKYTDPDDAKRFVAETGVDTLAVAIGTCHGLYPKGVTPKLRMDVLESIKGVVDIPLVLHGGSGNPDAEVAEAVRIGIQKVNISSDYKYAFFKKCREVLSTTELWDPNCIYPDCIVEAKKVVTQKMQLFNSVGKAAIYREQKTPQWRQEQN